MYEFAEEWGSSESHMAGNYRCPKRKVLLCLGDPKDPTMIQVPSKKAILLFFRFSKQPGHPSDKLMTMAKWVKSNQSVSSFLGLIDSLY